MATVDSEERFGEATGFLLHRLGIGAGRVIERTLRPLGLRGRDLRVLGFVVGSGGRSQRELVVLSGLDRSTMVGVVDRLEELGLVERRSDSGDRRKQSVVATDEGRRAFHEAAALLAEAESEFVSPCRPNGSACSTSC
ncbi:hypothetical protein GCM10029992_53760 [Glycomyces albus]